MPSRSRPPFLFFDFDNTITLSDVLDRVIERFSRTEAWRDLESAWQAGRISTRECLRGQIGGLSVTEEQLTNFIADVPIDPEFANIVAWAKVSGAELAIVSDNASVVVRQILRRHRLVDLQVFANELTFSGDQPEIRFPYSDATCPTCAHCKAQHLRQRAGRTRIFVGDGLSDVCPARAADVVFAKDSLAVELARCGVAYRTFRALSDVSQFLYAFHSCDSAG